MLGVLSLFLPQALGDGRDAVVGELLGTQVCGYTALNPAGCPVNSE